MQAGIPYVATAVDAPSREASHILVDSRRCPLHPAPLPSSETFLSGGSQLMIRRLTVSAAGLRRSASAAGSLKSHGSGTLSLGGSTGQRNGARQARQLGLHWQSCSNGATPGEPSRRLPLRCCQAAWRAPLSLHPRPLIHDGADIKV